LIFCFFFIKKKDKKKGDRAQGSKGIEAKNGNCVSVRATTIANTNVTGNIN